MSNQPMILVTMTGPDRPGIIAAMTGHIAAAGARIRDIEQTVTHTLLSLSVIIDFTTGDSDQKPLIKDLLFLAKEWGLDLDFQVIDEQDYRRRSNRNAYVLTIMGGGGQRRRPGPSIGDPGGAPGQYRAHLQAHPGAVALC